MDHPIDAFIAEAAHAQGLQLLPETDRLTWLRRATLDLIGWPPTLEEQDAFLQDRSANAHERVIQRLLASEQYGVRYGRHWLDVLRYADVDENMPAEGGMRYWRDWVIHAINQDLPYDAFVRAQIQGNRAAKRRTVSAAGHLSDVPPRPEDVFALGFLARGAASASNADHELAFSAVETISTAFLGMTVGCAKCHDHFYDPIKQSDYYAMKALFDPLALQQVSLASAEQVFAHGQAVQQHQVQLDAKVSEMRRFIQPYHHRLYEERLAALPPEAQAAIRKPEEKRSAAEQKLADDYFPILRIDPPKIKALLSLDQSKTYDRLLKEIAALKSPEPLPSYWTVAEDSLRAAATNYVLVTGDPTRPKRSQPVQPGMPFAPADLDFRHGRRETFVDWFTSTHHPLFARVAANRIWQWHFGSGLHPTPSDFGALGGKPVHPQLLDWLASQWIDHGFSMKWLHQTIMSSQTYLRASHGSPALQAANHKIDPDNRFYWKFPLRRLEAEAIRDSVLAAAGKLDGRLGGKSFKDQSDDPDYYRRSAYMARGYRSFAEVMPDFLQTFDAEDGRTVCSRRQETVTPPQALYFMNDALIESASEHLAQRLRSTSGDELDRMITLGFRWTLGRPPSPGERALALDILQGNPAHGSVLAWTLLNLDEFLYIR